MDRGTALLRSGDVRGAAEAFHAALVTGESDEIGAHHGLGMALSAVGESWAAVGCFRAALRLRIDHVPSYLAMAQAYRDLHRFSDAVGACDQARRLGFDTVEVQTHLAVSLSKDGRHREAFTAYRRAWKRCPDEPSLLSQIGLCLVSLGRVRWGLAFAQRAVVVAPDWFGSHGNLGLVLYRMHRIDEAKACYERALELAPGNPAVLYNLSILQLERGHYCREHFLRYANHWLEPLPGGDAKRWCGEEFEGRTLLVVGRNGLGDTLQFVRYLPRVKARGGRVVLVVQDALVAFLRGVDGVDEVRGRSSPQLDHDLEVSILEMPGIFDDTLDTIPRDVPYLRADASLRRRWAHEISDDARLSIGLAWQGNLGQRDGLFRSCSLRDMAPLAGIEGVRFFSLQKGAGSEELRNSPTGLYVHDFGDELDGRAGTFMDTAALMESLDLVITVDTSVCHLAGALGRPVWLVLPDWADWRWMLGRSDSAWYPTMRLFRQPRPFDWASPFREVRDALLEWLARSQPTQT